MNNSSESFSLSQNEKKKLIKKHTPRTKTLKTVTLAFIFGALITGLAEWERLLLIGYGVSGDNSTLLVSLTFILIASVLTALGLFSKIAKHAGAGTLVPITGFSNSITSEAIDSSSEGYVLGVGAKIFTVAGPVLLWGTFSGVIYGIYLFLSEM